jgi:hypothetical protein
LDGKYVLTKTLNNGGQSVIMLATYDGADVVVKIYTGKRAASDLRTER